jgi:methionyl aminopeptidase
MKKELTKTAEEVELIRKSSLLVSKTLAEVAKVIKPGVSTLDLDKVAYEFIKDHGAEPAFLGYQGFPNTCCISINEQVVHGIPTKDPIKDTDIVSVDVGVLSNQYYGDSAYTFAMPNVSQAHQDLMRHTKISLQLGIAAALAGNRVGDIGNAVQSYVEAKGYGVVKDLVGHGLGTSLHEEPQVPNYGKKGNGVLLLENMVIAIEPMINLGTGRVRLAKDDWTIITADKKYSAHFEHTICVKKQEAELLSSFKEIEEALEKNSNCINI